jgi:hypothetical protein
MMARVLIATTATVRTITNGAFIVTSLVRVYRRVIFRDWKMNLQRALRLRRETED